ncbi:MAG TPA: NAD-dependent succinate-semialdehyde dehydrogenase [Candidatus Polarisedimenticolia bacterium]|nr:NAD-dependent succinate-semialdehyde dehydrogenase [Candidatus Polarisedimenticolia bacterium]
MSTHKVIELPRRTVSSVSPLTGELLREYEQHSDEMVENKIALAAATFRDYRKVAFSKRAAMMVRAAETLEKEKEIVGRMMTQEMGKTFKSAVQEAEKCAFGCRYYAENAERFLADEEAKTNATRSFVRYQPIGPVLAVMPWNFPFWQVFRFAAPALMAGNVGLLKHASNVPQCALAIEDIFRRAGFPEGAFQTLLIGSDRVNQVIADRRVAAVTLTGSVGAGSSVATAAGKAIKKCVLELGGSDPFIVMPSADLDKAIETAVQARVINNGQSCIAAKRFIVHHKIAEQFDKKFVPRMASLKVGDPMDAATDVGPLATADVLKGLEEQVRKTVEMGARVLLGGKRLERKGNFFAPTVLADIPKGSPAFEDELFGPVASLYRARDMSDAIEIANNSIFGLGACAWTNDPAERELFINEIESGLAFINGMVASDARIPFGGVKHSGYGRELSHHGIREFANVKSVCIQEAEPGKSRTE